MRLSPFHIELCKMIADGLPNREIKKKVQISDSRLSILKANPLMQRQISKYAQLKEDAYRKAIQKLEEKAVEVAQGLLMETKNPLNPPAVRLAAQKEVLDRLASVSSNAKPRGAGGELVYEQLLRVTKKTDGDALDQEDIGAFDAQSAQKELAEDFRISDEGMILEEDELGIFTVRPELKAILGSE